MLRRIVFCLCLLGLVQIAAPTQLNASQTAVTILGGVDHLPQHVVGHLFREASDYYRLSYLDVTAAYQKGELVMFETTSNGERAVMMDLDGNCLLSVIADIL
ncbi:MAG: hypothetical protein AAGN35_08030 [Bacteroidota bacterium]